MELWTGETHQSHESPHFDNGLSFFRFARERKVLHTLVLNHYGHGYRGWGANGSIVDQFIIVVITIPVRCQGRFGQKSNHLAHPSEAIRPPVSNGREFFGKVLVQESVNDRIGARTRHAQHVTNGINETKRLVRQIRKHIYRVGHSIQDVQGQPTDAEDGPNPAQELDGAL